LRPRAGAGSVPRGRALLADASFRFVCQDPALRAASGDVPKTAPTRISTVMTETTTAANKARTESKTENKTTKAAASPFGMPDYGMPTFDMLKFEMPKFDLANMEVPEAFRDMAEKGVGHARDAYAKAKVASDEAADVLGKTYEAAAKRATDYNRKLIEIARTNTGAAFDNVNALLAVKSPSEFFELATAQMRQQFDVVSTQNKELCALAQEIATEAVEPMKAGMSKVFNKA
jgi:phasin